MSEGSSLTPEQWALWSSWMQAHRLLMQEVDRVLQRDFDITKAEFSVLVSLDATTSGTARVTDLARLLGWEKSRVAHQLTRMERRGLIARDEAGAAGRRTAVSLTVLGRRRVRRAIRGHAATVRRLAFDRLSPEQLAAIASWSHALNELLAPGAGEDGVSHQARRARVAGA